METIFEYIREERSRQDAKWGANRSQNSLYWLGILVEEVGEVAKSLIEFDMTASKKELIQCASVIVAWLEQYEREGL